MNKTTAILLLAMLVLPAAAAAATETPVPIVNPGFELENGQGLPPGWRVSATTGQAAADTGVFHDGLASLRLNHTRPSRSSVFSEPLALQVGRFYRLRAWVRTVDAFTDPADRYPTPVAACLTMESFPFTNHS
ncbi:MAG TPA: hypothetical protein VLQ89_02765, partial [Candidatus Binatia bacterium]|nr:hypothetical protein [Candidatus Binatia bacterium]